MNQLMTSDVFFYLCKVVVFLSLLFILSRMYLLNLPVSLFAELVRVINPAKNNVDRLSKYNPHKINNKLRNETSLSE